MNISTVKKLREYLSEALKLPYDSLIIRSTDGKVAQNKTLQNLLEEDFIQGIGKAAVYNSTIKQTKKRIEKYCHIPMKLLVFVRKNRKNKPFAEQTHIKTVRNDWES